MKFGLNVISALCVSSVMHVNAFTPVPQSLSASNQAVFGFEQRNANFGTSLTVISDKEETLRALEDNMNEMDEAVLFGEQAAAVSSSQRKVSRSGNLMPPIQSNKLDHSTTNPLINKLHTMRTTITSCPQIWSELAKYVPSEKALFDNHLCDEEVDLTFKEAHKAIRKSASIFQALGVKKGTNIAVLGENSAQWLLIDHGIQMAGGVSAVRGADAPTDELRYIYEHSDSAGVAVLQGPRLLTKLANDARKLKLNSALGLSNESHGDVETVILMHREKKSDEDIEKLGKDIGVNVLVFQDLMNAANPMSEADIADIDLGKDDIATIVYTSGTTGQPKGVMLSHGSLLHQIGHRLAPTKGWDEGEPLPGECMVSLLPVWHITERTFELFMLTRGCSVVYSTIRHFKNDLATHQPEWMVLVPRVLEKIALGVQDKFAKGSPVVKALVKLFTTTSGLRSQHKKIAKGLVVGEKGGNKLVSNIILAALAPLNAVGDKIVWSKVKDGFGGKNKLIISGGSALAGSLETFYENCGLNICVGYGLTECSPLIAHRRSDSNLVTGGCVGQPCLETELRVVDPEIKPGDINTERQSVPDGQIGVVIARGPQVMNGYYKNPEATAKAIDQYGFFDTGDLGKINPATGDLILTGRCKDTIVLSNGENIEPQPIEDAILGGSSMVEQILLTGQDGKTLTAVVVLSPNELVNAGYLDSKTGATLQKANEKINNPKASPEQCADDTELLSSAAIDLRNNDSLITALKKEVKASTKQFRKWEQVGDVYVTLEPFAMSNGLLTQSYKVKRDAVVNRYMDEL
jgi:long-chain acyl-CoA synthetase